MPRFHSFAALCALALFTPAASRVRGPAGPEAVIAMHKELFAALDRGDADAAAAFVDGDRKGRDGTTTLMVAGPSDAPILGDDAAASQKILMELAAASKNSKSPWTTTIARELQVDCYSPDLSYAVLQFERAREVDGKKEVRRYSSTALVRYADKQWKLIHWHVSSADAPANVAAR